MAYEVSTPERGEGLQEYTSVYGKIGFEFVVTEVLREIIREFKLMNLTKDYYGVNHLIMYLEALMTPYLDGTYYARTRGLLEEKNIKINLLYQQRTEEEARLEEDDVIFEYAMRQFRELMDVMNRRSLLPEREFVDKA